MYTTVLLDCIVNCCKVGVFVCGTGGEYCFLGAVLDEVLDLNAGRVSTPRYLRFGFALFSPTT